MLDLAALEFIHSSILKYLLSAYYSPTITTTTMCKKKYHYLILIIYEL